MSDQIKKEIADYLAGHAHLRLATVSGDGNPDTATVAYVNDGATVYFVTDRRTLKAANITGNRIVAFTVDGDYHGWKETQGMQIVGQALPVDEPDEMENVKDLFAEKFPLMYSIPGGFAMNVYRVEPQHGFLLDNSQEPRQ
ncbi:MAG: pyridoxamine 5'-phosphate oxidase family protein [candidate division Zixibacteria bacterium]|nr:pyridoxamine 5'-phosphate oxidase family protein [candidate division Zixibacteria bacterium]